MRYLTLRRLVPGFMAFWAYGGRLGLAIAISKRQQEGPVCPRRDKEYPPWQSRDYVPIIV